METKRFFTIYVKKTYGIKIQTKIKFKIYAEGEQNSKLMKWSKNTGGLTQVKAICFLYTYRYIMAARKSTL